MGEEGWEVGEVKMKEGVIERNVTPNSQHLVSDRSKNLPKRETNALTEC